MKENFPHENVYARLGVSKIHGVGVFAIRDIPKNTNIFPDDKMDVFWFNKKDIDESKIDPEFMRLYSDFCIVKDGKYGTPINFNSITPAWYMNEPLDNEEENAYPDKNYVFFAKRDIKKGEELTTRYSLFSEHLERY